ncbi:MAG: T9SS type A sorting domain-containing protein [bacterium]|nr:T9SS type A sorting domain-containing protein [bacterium]
MKKFFGLIVGTQFIVSSLVNATNVSGVISTNTVWNTAGSPYIVTGNVLVDTFATLTIEPGVEVRLESAKYIMVKGILNAIGTASDSIIITKNGGSGWKRLWLKPTSICSLKYCRIEYAETSAIYNDSGTVYIGYNTIKNNSTSYSVGGGIRNSGSAMITNNTISNNSATNVYYGGGGGIFNDSFAIITNNIISNNSGANGGAITNTGSGIITNNTIINNSASGTGGGISNSGPAIISNNTISNNSVGSGFNGGGICNSGGFATTPTTITNNTITNNSADNGGAICDYGISTIYKYNTITDITASAIYITHNVLIRTNNISAIGYAVYNTTTYNIDGRYNWWNTANTDTINQKISDYYDDFTLGKVFYQPFLNASFSDTVAPSVPINLTSVRITDSTFNVNWTDPVDVSGISEYYYKLGSEPISDFDTTGIFHFSTNTINITQNESLFVWLVDSSGNVNYNNRTSIYIVGIEEKSKIKTPSTTLRASQNPFIKSTIILYALPEKADVLLKIYDISGRTVKTLVNGKKDAGSYEANFDTKGLASGIYFAELSAGNISINKKLILIK